MTKSEFAKALGKSKYFARDCFRAAEEAMPSIRAKRGVDKRFFADYTRAEVDCVLSLMHGGRGATFAERERIDNAFVERAEGRVHKTHGHSEREYLDGNLMLKGTLAFLKDTERKCCSNCARCAERERSTKTSRIVAPFCLLYNRYCEYMGNVYEDYCAQWERGEARVWRKDRGSIGGLPWKTES